MTNGSRLDRENPAFRDAFEVLVTGASARAFPAAVAEVGSSQVVLWQAAVGRLHESDDAPPAASDTVFDLASLTKVIATTTLAMRLADEGRLALDTPIARWLPSWRGADRDDVTVADLLAHCSGLTAYLPFYRDCDGRGDFERAICTLPLEYRPRARAVYSDLGFILLGFIVADAGGRPLDEQFQRVCGELGGLEVTFRPPQAWKARTAPTGLDSWRGRTLVGEVHDRNAWALGGVAGHAGLFGTAPAVGLFARAFLSTVRDARSAPPLSRSETARRFIMASGVPSSSRALGWDRMLPTSSCGTRMHPSSVGHTGYTGTSLWIDPVQDVYVVLLTNRVHPSDDNQGILAVRPRFHDAVMTALLGGASAP